MNKFEIREYRVKVSTAPDGTETPGGFAKFGMLHVLDEEGNELMNSLQEIPATKDELDKFFADGSIALEAEVKRMGEEVGKLLASRDEYKAACDKLVSDARVERVALRAQVRALRDTGIQALQAAQKLSEALRAHSDPDAAPPQENLPA